MILTNTPAVRAALRRAVALLDTCMDEALIGLDMCTGDVLVQFLAPAAPSEADTCEVRISTASTSGEDEAPRRQVLTLAPAWRSDTSSDDMPQADLRSPR